MNHWLNKRNIKILKCELYQELDYGGYYGIKGVLRDDKKLYKEFSHHYDSTCTEHPLSRYGYSRSIQPNSVKIVLYSIRDFLKNNQVSIIIHGESTKKILQTIDWEEILTDYLC